MNYISFVGDKGVGKTSAITAATTGTFPAPPSLHTCDPTTAQTTTPEGQAMSCHLSDNAEGNFDCRNYDNHRLLDIMTADVVVVCFAVDQPASFANVDTRWMP